MKPSTSTRRKRAIRRHRQRTPQPADRFDWRDLPPIPPAERVAIPRTPSQTFLKHFDRCPRAAFLYVKHRGGPGSHELNRGTVFHVVVERLTRRLIERGENETPPDVGKVELNDVLAEHPEWTVPALERDYLRMLVHHWCLGTWIEPDQVVGVEEMLTLELGPWTIRGKVDLIQQPEFNVLHLTDYKTQRNMPNADEWHAGGSDVDPYSNTPRIRWAGNFQTQLYATLAAFGRTAEGLTLGEGIDRMRLYLRFPVVLFEDGIGRKEADVSRVQLTDFRDDLVSQLGALEHAIDSGKWQPIPGSQCGECPAEYECPLPRHLRAESQGAEIRTLAEAERLGVTWRFMNRRARALKAALRKAAEANGWEMIRTGTDTALKFNPESREGFKPKSLPFVREGIEGAVEYGHPFDLDRFVTTSQSTKWDERKVPPKAIEKGNEK